MMEVVKLRKQQARTAELFENLWLQGVLVVIVYCVGSVVFRQLSNGEWSFTDAFYFTAISLTTIGLGDFTPNADQIVFWYFYIAINLGLVASAIGGFGEIASLIASTAKELAEDVEEYLDEDSPQFTAAASDVNNLAASMIIGLFGSRRGVGVGVGEDVLH